MAGFDSVGEIPDDEEIDSLRLLDAGDEALDSLRLALKDDLFRSGYKSDDLAKVETWFAFIDEHPTFAAYADAWPPEVLALVEELVQYALGWNGSKRFFNVRPSAWRLGGRAASALTEARHLVAAEIAVDAPTDDEAMGRLFGKLDYVSAIARLCTAEIDQADRDTLLALRSATLRAVALTADGAEQIVDSDRSARNPLQSCTGPPGHDVAAAPCRPMGPPISRDAPSSAARLAKAA